MITIGIISMLFVMLAVAAGPMRIKAKTKKTEGIIGQISLGLETYHSKAGMYPPDGLDDGTTVETEEGTRLESGAALTYAVTRPFRARKKQPDGSFRDLGEQEAVCEFKGDNFSEPYLGDPDAIELLDGFGEPFHYDRLQGTGRETYSRQDSGDVHLGWEERDLVHHGDPREEEELAVSRAGPQNVGQFDLWSHGKNGHTEDEVPEDVICNWKLPSAASE